MPTLQGLLGYLTEGGAPVRNALKGLLSGDLTPLQNAGSELSALANPTMQQKQKLAGILAGNGQSNLGYDEVMNNPGVQAAMNFAPMGIAHTVYHGSPHKFDKFDMSKIGTGEGAQAYGHGLYFAEAPETAMSYRASVSGKNGKQFGLEDGPVKGIATLIAAKGNKGEEMARKAYSNLGDNLEPAIEKAKQAINNNSQLYKVDIPDELIPRMLDWDKPLSQQHPEVQKAWERFINSKQGKRYAKELGDASNLKNSRHGGELLGEDLIKNVMGANEASNTYRQAASDYFKQQGIPGIRYLDGNSRGTGGGTSNFVIFDDKIPKILERNGVPLK